MRQGDLLLLVRDFSSWLCFVCSGEKSNLRFYSFCLQVTCVSLWVSIGAVRMLEACRREVQPDPAVGSFQRRLAGDFKHIFPLSASFPPSFTILLLLAQRRSLYFV